MATRLYQIVSFAAVAPGGQATLAHAINENGVPLKPDIIAPDAFGFSIVSCTDLAVTVQNNNLAAGDVNLLLHRIYSPERAFGAAQTTALPVQPFTIVGGNAASGGSGLVFNVKDFGAVGDGVTDDRQGVQDAIDAAGTAGGGIVYFPPGEYLIVPSGGVGLLVDNPYVQLVGAGAGASTVRGSANAANGLVQLIGGNQTVGEPYEHAAAALGNAVGFGARDLSFIGACALGDLLPFDSGTYAVSPGIAVSSGAATNDVSGVIIERCTFEGFDQCILSAFSANLPTAFGWTIRDNVFTGLFPTSYATKPTLHLPIRLCGQDVLINNNRTDGFAYGCAIYPCGQSLPIAGVNRVTENHFSMAVAYDVGVYLSGPNECIVAHNNVTLPPGRYPFYDSGVLADGGIKVSAHNDQAGMGNVTVLGNIVRGGQIKISSMVNARIVANEVLDSPVYGLMIDTAITANTPSPFQRYLTIADNTFVNPSGSGIAATSTDIRYFEVLIEDNLIVNPGAYGIKLDNAINVDISSNDIIYTEYTQTVGTLALTLGSPNIVGTGTAFTAFDVGRRFVADGTTYTITIVTDPTHITVTPNAARTNATATFEWFNTGPQGTLNTTNGSAAVTGNGTSFVWSDVGKTIIIDGQPYVIDVVTSAAAITLDSAITTPSNPAATYTFNLGTVTINVGSPNVTGIDTSFSPSDAGKLITIDGNSYTIRVVNGPDSLTLASNALSTAAGTAWVWSHPQTIALGACSNVRLANNLIDFTTDTVNSHTALIVNGGCLNIQADHNTIVGFAFGVRYQANTAHSDITNNFIRGRVVNNTDVAIFLDTSAGSVGLRIYDNNCYGYNQSAVNNTADWRRNIFGTSLAPTDLTGPSPPAIAAGAGAGAGAAVAIAGSDRQGSITVTTAGAPAANSDICTITFVVQRLTTPYPVITPVGVNANVADAFISFVNAATFRLGVGAVALAGGGTVYTWNYQV